MKYWLNQTSYNLAVFITLIYIKHGNDSIFHIVKSLDLPHATWHLVMEESSQPPPNDKQFP